MTGIRLESKAASQDEAATQDKAFSQDNEPLLKGACCLALASLAPVALYQFHLLPKLPDPPFQVFDSQRITMSRTAHPFGIPDALLGLASFGVTLGLAILSKRSTAAKKALGVKLAMDASVAGYNAIRQVTEFGKLCSWCTATAISAGVMAYAGKASMQAVAVEGTEAARRALDGKRRSPVPPQGSRCRFGE